MARGFNLEGHSQVRNKTALSRLFISGGWFRPAKRRKNSTLPYRPHPDCDAGRFYLLNNLFPGFHADGTLNVGNAALSISPLGVVPPSAVRIIGDASIEKSSSLGLLRRRIQISP